jgi:hypothetical protein
VCLSVRFHSRKRQPRERDRGDGIRGWKALSLGASKRCEDGSTRWSGSCRTDSPPDICTAYRLSSSRCAKICPRITLIDANQRRELCSNNPNLGGWVVKPPLLWLYISVYSRHSRAKRLRLRRSRSGPSAIIAIVPATSFRFSAPLPAWQAFGSSWAYPPGCDLHATSLRPASAWQARLPLQTSRPTYFVVHAKLRHESHREGATRLLGKTRRRE